MDTATRDRIFFAPLGVSPVEARIICSACLVRQECLDFATTHHERFGVWGGLSEKERRLYIKQVKQSRKVIPVGVPTTRRYVAQGVTVFELRSEALEAA